MSRDNSNIEPDIIPTEAGVQLSIAVSLKRIADALESLSGPLNAYGEGIGDCIQGQFERSQR